MPVQQTSTTPPGAAVRTFKARRGRMSASQADAIERLWPSLGVAVDGTPLDLPSLFGRTAPVAMEIGFGMGEATVEMAAAQPDHDVLAVDVHTPGVGTLLRTIEERGLGNVRVAEGDALVLLRDMLPAGALDLVRVLFPDPWPKTRHHKRRLVTAAFCDLVAQRLRPGGRLHVATDWPAYADQVREVLAGHPDLALDDTAPWRARTRFEAQGVDAGRPPVDISATRR